MTTAVKDTATRRTAPAKTTAAAGTNSSSTSKAKAKVTQASAKLRETTSAARQAASGAYTDARRRASTAYEGAKIKATKTTQAAGQAIDDNPLAAALGGLALGALIGAVLPRSDRESELLGGVGEKLNQSGRKAASAAREAGREKLEGLGLLGDNAPAKVSEWLETAISAFESFSGNAKSGAR